MVCGKQHRIAKGILSLTLIWFINGCAYQQPSLQPAPEEPPSAVEIKPETPVSEPVTPNAPESETADLEKPTHESRLFLHKVRWPEETYSHIAKWYTGTVKNWKVIAELNPELDPKKIDIGDTISIPEDLLTTRKPMPHSFVRASSVRKKETSVSSSKKVSTPSEPPKLFGPLESESSVNKNDAAKLFGPVETRQSSIEPDAEKLFGPIE